MLWGGNCQTTPKWAIHDRTALWRRRQGWDWSEVGKIAFRVENNRMQLRLLGLSSKSPLDFEFKWTDNIPASGDILDFYHHGNVAPGGRFNYHYRAP